MTQAELRKLLEANNWRIRRAALEMFADLASNSKSTDLFETHLQELFFSYLTDKVNAIREFGNRQLVVGSIHSENTRIRVSRLGPELPSAKA